MAMWRQVKDRRPEPDQSVPANSDAWRWNVARSRNQVRTFAHKVTLGDPPAGRADPNTPVY